MSKEKDSGAKGREEPKNEQDYTPGNVAEMKDSKSEKESFKKGGSVKKKAGHAGGKKPGHRLDKRARGGRMGGGHSPLSMAANAKGRPGGEYDGTTDKEDD